MEATLEEPWAYEGKLPIFRKLLTWARASDPEIWVDSPSSTIWEKLLAGRLGGPIGWHWNRCEASRPRSIELLGVAVPETLRPTLLSLYVPAAAV
jgi:hypothetical protein